ncbi:hypothetical protein SHIRM173S_01926 [Streptomyces hirsutus]
MDLDAVLARRPQVVLVDELAHTNVPGSRNAKRWQDVEELLAAGIDVLSTLNIQHLESLGDVVESITGVRQQETVPDEVVRRADQTELVDMTPEALRRRMAHGNVYQPDKVDAALSNYFRPGNLTALRELALLWVADRVDEYLQRYRSEHDVSAIWGSRERIVVGLTGGPEGRTLIRRAARLAEKGAGGEVLAVYIARGDGLPPPRPANWPSSGPWWKAWAAPSTTWSGTTFRPPCSPSRARRTRPRSCWAPRAARRGSTSSAPASERTVARDSGPDLDVHIEKVQALDAGADDYVTKPFGMDELLARLRAAVRRAEPSGEDEGDLVVETDGFTVDLAAKKVHRDGKDVRLTPPTWHLLEVLVRNGGRLVARSGCSGRSGGRRTGRRRTTCACTWRSCAASWRPTRPIRSTSSPSRAWATASNGE